VEGIDLTTLIVTVVGILGSAGAWQFYAKRMELKAKEKVEDKGEQNLYRDDLRERVAKLEQMLTTERETSNSYRIEITELKTTMAEYKVRLEFLEKENLRLKGKAGEI